VSSYFFLVIRGRRNCLPSPSRSPDAASLPSSPVAKQMVNTIDCDPYQDC
ncbi:hypothetical protein E2562_016360, partial [Oryza meyeriana var. granulata]